MPEVNEGKPVVDEPVVGADGKHPETVSWSQYVGIKESLGKKLDTATGKVATLEEQLKTSIKTEEHNQIKSELEKERSEKKLISDELNKFKEQSITEKRATLIARGIPKEKTDSLSGDALNAVLMVLDGTGSLSKPKPDLGSGGSGFNENLSSTNKIASGWAALHPK